MIYMLSWYGYIHRVQKLIIYTKCGETAKAAQFGASPEIYVHQKETYHTLNAMRLFFGIMSYLIINTQPQTKEINSPTSKLYTSEVLIQQDIRFSELFFVKSTVSV